MEFDYEVMNCVEQLRLERKMTILEITEGVISRRNYSRYLSGEIPITLEVLTKLLTKLGVPLHEFVIYMTNKNIFNNLDEAYYLDLIRNEQYEEAYNRYYHSIKDKKLNSIYASRTIPICKNLMLYKLGKLFKEEAKKNSSRIIDLKEMFRKKHLNDDEIESLYLYIRICDDEDKERIADYLLNMLFSREYKLTAIHYEFCLTLTYLIVLTIITEHHNKEKYKRNIIKQVINEALDFFRRAKFNNNDILLFDILYKYIKKNNIHNNDIIFYYISSILSTNDTEFLNGRKFAITREDINIYFTLLKDEELINSNLYERIMNNALES